MHIFPLYRGLDHVLPSHDCGCRILRLVRRVRTTAPSAAFFVFLNPHLGGYQVGTMYLFPCLHSPVLLHNYLALVNSQHHA